MQCYNSIGYLGDDLRLHVRSVRDLVTSAINKKNTVQKKGSLGTQSTRMPESMKINQKKFSTNLVYERKYLY